MSKDPQILTEENPSPKKYAVLLHGIGGLTYDMGRMEQKLRSEGFEVVNISYSVMGYTGHDIEGIAKKLHEKIKAKVGEGIDEINFVGFSLGAVLAITILDQNRKFYSERIKQVVQISPPNKGSFIADSMPTWLIKKTFPVYHQLRTGEDGVSKITSKIEPYYNLGIIATMHPKSWFEKRFSKDIGDHDGVVTVANTELNGKRADVLITGLIHKQGLINSEILELVSHFVKEGQFQTNEQSQEDLSASLKIPKTVGRIREMVSQLIQGARDGSKTR